MNIETAEKLSTLEAKYEADRQSRELVLVTNRLQQQKNAVLVAAAFGIFLVFLSVFLIRDNQQKNNQITFLKEQNKVIIDSLNPLLSQRDQAEMLLKNSFSNHFIYSSEQERFANNFLWARQRDQYIILLLIGFDKNGLTSDVRRTKSVGWFEDIINNNTIPNPKTIVQGMLEMTVTHAATGTTFTTCNTKISCLVYDTENQNMAYYGHTPCWVRKAGEIEKIYPIDHKKNNECASKRLENGETVFLIGLTTDLIMDLDKDFKLIDSIDKAITSSVSEDVKSQNDLVISTIEYWKNTYGSNFEAIFVGVTI